ncbi:hypothetical protein [Actinomadura parmotrematis]|uniref:Uncharacterized protein n=1 Tax=Actinomadura parmotrematis TaxID=2864039 RepID=A0ABS7FPC8_9ACTN|nr:hypothetical protein [Actinomadura parmotrematis]MBW8482224.1 hypothetical protein [Actinomadura parmotrematis]
MNSRELRIRGWDVVVPASAAVSWRARRIGRLTDYQRRCGALEEVIANNPGELAIICHAQRELVLMLGAAERIGRNGLAGL